MILIIVHSFLKGSDVYGSSESFSRTVGLDSCSKRWIEMIINKGSSKSLYNAPKERIPEG
jgi:hypothetical protein